jgi:flagellar biosynthesis/type III secretory pathway protein FliH
MDDLNAAIKEIQACPPARALQHHECVQQKRAKQNEARECRKLLEKLSEGANEEGEEKEQKDRVKGGEKGRAEGKEKGKEKGKQEGKEKEGTLTRAGIVQLVSPTWHDGTITSIYICKVRIFTIFMGIHTDIL